MIDTHHYGDSEYPLSKPRRVRLNIGPQLNERLVSACTITGEQGALCFDQMQRWLGLLSPAPERMKELGILSSERTRKILRPWIDLGYIQYQVFYVGQRGWLWLTSKGLRYLNIELRPYEPAPASLNHLYAVNAIRYFIAVRRPGDTWRSERILRAEQNASTRGSKFAHLPDAEVISTNGSVRAIECELTSKSEKRMEEIIFDLAANARYNAIWYFLPPDVKNTVTTAIHKLPVEHHKRFSLYTLKGELYPS